MTKLYSLLSVCLHGKQDLIQTLKNHFCAKKGDVVILAGGPSDHLVLLETLIISADTLHLLFFAHQLIKFCLFTFVFLGGA